VCPPQFFRSGEKEIHIWALGALTGRWIITHCPSMRFARSAASLSSGDMMIPYRSNARKSDVSASATPGPSRVNAVYTTVFAEPRPSRTTVGVTKLALAGVTTTLASELGHQNIRVNAIGPGMTKTDAGLSLTPDDSPWVQSIMARCPIQGRDTPDALCGALLLLVSPAGRWMTGQTLNVDGGWIMRT